MRKSKMEKIPTDIEKVFLASRVNGGPYGGESLPSWPWEWPKNTWFSQRLRRVRKWG